MFYTGGGASLDNGSPYFTAVQTVYNYVMQQNQKGKHTYTYTHRETKIS